MIDEKEAIARHERAEHLAAQINKLLAGYEIYESLAATTYVLCELFALCPSSEQGAQLFSTLIEGVGTVMDDKMANGDCSWQRTKQ